MKYSLEDIKTAFDCKNYLPKDRFMHYFTKNYGYSEHEAKNLFKIFMEFPRNLRSEDEKTLNELMPKIVEVTNLIQNVNRLPYAFETKEYHDKFMINKVLYKENDKINEIIVDFRKTEDVLIYSEIIKRNVELLARLNYCCEFNKANEGQVYVFDGDVYNTHDRYYYDKSNVYLAQTNGTFKRLLYTKDIGYLVKGKPHYSE